MRAEWQKRKVLLRPGQQTVTACAVGEIPEKDTSSTLRLDSIHLETRDREPDLSERPHSFTDMRDAVRWAGQMMAESPAARGLWDFAAAKGWSAGFSALDEGGYAIDVVARTVTLDDGGMTPSALGRSTYFRNAFIISLIRALRDIWHEERVEAGRDFGPEALLMAERVRAADCDTVAVLAAWELRGAGHADVWRHLIGSSEGDMAIIFTRFLDRDPSALFSGAALAYAFRQWYADEARVDSSDHHTLEILDETLEAMTGGTNPFGAQELTGAFLEDMTLLPGGMKYLSGCGDTVRRDPFFSGMRDPINQAHLFQIVHDGAVTRAGNVPFRDGTLARRIFPEDRSSLSS